MTLELRPEITASPEDLFGRKGEIMRDWSGVSRLIRVADHISEILPEVEAKGLMIRDFHDEWLVYERGATLKDVKLSFFKDRVDGFVWISESEVERFKDIFGEKRAVG